MLEGVSGFDFGGMFKLLLSILFKIVSMPVKLIMMLPGWARFMFSFLFLCFAVVCFFWYRKHKDDYLGVRY